MHDKAAQVVVALSGGMDSCVCAALAVRDFGADATAALHISYGQRTERRELASFEAICERLQIRQRLRVRTPFFHAIGGSALTDDKISIPDAGPEIGVHIPVTYVPFRNAHFLSAAVSWAEVLGAVPDLHWSSAAGQLRLSRLPSRVLPGIQRSHSHRYQSGHNSHRNTFNRLTKGPNCDAWP